MSNRALLVCTELPGLGAAFPAQPVTARQLPHPGEREKRKQEECVCSFAFGEFKTLAADRARRFKATAASDHVVLVPKPHVRVLAQYNQSILYSLEQERTKFDRLFV